VRGRGGVWRASHINANATHRKMTFVFSFFSFSNDH
jgi:hypothetical protein